MDFEKEEALGLEKEGNRKRKKNLYCGKMRGKDN